MFPHFRPAAAAAALEEDDDDAFPFSEESSTLEVSFLGPAEESLPNPMKPWDVRPSRALFPANLANRASL